ncbi:hypothetical protein KAX17_01245 [Candidatus Bipolaricaulota bacterium]|nr:hypothetical protein [Candidatus Bipolaricaulota bacterium]
MTWKPSFTELVKALALLCWLGFCLAVLLVGGVESSGEVWLSRISSALVLLVIALWPITSRSPHDYTEDRSEIRIVMRELIEEKEKRLREKDDRIRGLERENELLLKEIEEAKLKVMTN